MGDFSEIPNLFTKMEYDIKTQPSSLSQELVNKLKVYYQESHVSVRDIITKAPVSVDNIKRAQLINELTNRFKLNILELMQFESVDRGFSLKDADTSVNQFIENFQYYSSHVFKKKTGEEIPVIIVLQDHFPLPYLGSILGSTFANGNKVVLNPVGKGYLGMVYSIVTSARTCFPDGTIEVFYNEPKSIATVFDLDERVLVYYCGDKYDYEFHRDPIRQPLLKYLDGRIPMMVFNSADLQSASYSAIKAVWGFQGMMPWSVNTILVQEDVFEEFVLLLKEKLLKTKINSTISEISYPKLCTNYEMKFKKLVEDARKSNLDYWISDKDEKFSALLIIGDKLYDNNVIEKDVSPNLPFATILPFRNTTEAITLANNSRQGLAASVWTENIGLVNEVIGKLQVGTVWVNSHGQFRPEVSFGHHKLGYGFGCINGIEGALQNEYVSEEKSGQSIVSHENKVNVEEVVSKLKKAQINWSKLSARARSMQLQKIALLIESNKNDFCAKTGLNIQELDEWIHFLFQVKPAINNSICDQNSDIKSFREPIGLIALVMSKVDLKFVISAIANGNSLMVIGDVINGFYKMCEEIGKHLPGTMQCTPAQADTLNDIVKERLIDILYVQNNLKLRISHDVDKCVFPLNPTGDYTMLTSRIKNVWYNCGDSYVL